LDPNTTTSGTGTKFGFHFGQFLTVIKLFIMSYVGIATTLGQPVEIPIILRSLADSIALLHENDKLPLFNPSLLATLDVGKDGKSQVVKNYAHSWWTSRKPRDLNDVSLLGPSTVESCIEHYRKQCANAKQSSANPKSSSTAGADAKNASAAEAGFQLPASAGLYASISSYANISPNASARYARQCRNCKIYCQQLSDVLLDMLKFRNYASAMSTSSLALLNLGLRKTSIFHLLHQAAISKETAGIPNPAPRPKVHNISESPPKASPELSVLPASSYKWTWGETLSKEEVLALRRTGTRPGKASHSGYDVDMAEGRMSGQYSSGNPTHLTSNGLNEDVPGDTSFVPKTNLSFPTFFSNYNQLSYNPYRQSTSSSLINPPSILMRQGTEQQPICISDTDNESQDEDNPAPASSAFLLAEHWEDEDQASDSAVVQAMEPPAFILARDWEAAVEPAPAFLRAEDREEDSALAPALLLADDWEEGADEEGADEEGADDEGSDNKGADDEESPSALALRLAEDWQGVEDGEPQPTAAPLLADSNQSSVAPAHPMASTSARTYGPEDFAFLQDNMFDSDSSEE
jgi:hypothetical protein